MPPDILCGLAGVDLREHGSPNEELYVKMAVARSVESARYQRCLKWCRIDNWFGRRRKNIRVTQADRIQLLQS
ncbi:hypothetical protein [Paraburkholderia phytofirmans]|uniref:hypothetical protein n=1 Tax=Paraburkholderia phytofirmans TaxID=261302 RepID=UPI0013966FB6|nr:hypothetical protein [Paraburkholderia phytofirmans]